MILGLIHAYLHWGEGPRGLTSFLQRGLNGSSTLGLALPILIMFGIGASLVLFRKRVILKERERTVQESWAIGVPVHRRDHSLDKFSSVRLSWPFRLIA